MEKILVSYFSASGVTKKVANNLALFLQADLFEIEPVQKYSDADLDWNNPTSRSSLEMKDLASRPQIVKKISNLEEYNTIFIGFPIWWGVAPRIINTFIEENDLHSKDIYIFATSGGSGVTTSFEDLKSKYPKLHFISAKLLTVYQLDEEIKSWLI